MATDSKSATKSAGTSQQSYWQLTRTATYGFLSALPLIALYEILILVANTGRTGQIRVSSEVWLKRWMSYIDGPAELILGGALLLVGIGIVLYERKKKIPIRPTYFAGIVAESCLYAVFVAMLVSQVVWSIFAFAPTAIGASAQVAMEDLWTQIALSIGAGIYEELLFRVIIVGGLYAIFKSVLGFKTAAYILAATIGALLFSGIHYIGELGDPFTLPSFAFRFLFGLALNVLYLVRGFGVAAWTHALYDIMIVTNMLG